MFDVRSEQKKLLREGPIGHNQRERIDCDFCESVLDEERCKVPANRTVPIIIGDRSRDPAARRPVGRIENQGVPVRLEDYKPAIRLEYSDHLTQCTIRIVQMDEHAIGTATIE